MPDELRPSDWPTPMVTPTEFVAPGGGRPGHPLNLDEIRGIVQREIEDSNGGYGSLISEQRRGHLRAYYGKSIGNEKPDRSTIVMRDILEVVEWTMPSLMRMFTGGPFIWRYKPKEEGEQSEADKATYYINDEFMNNCDGFQIIYDWFKTALIEKNGFVKPYYYERREPQLLRYSGLTLDQVTELLSEADNEPISFDEYEEVMAIGEERIPVTLYDLEIRQWKINKGLAVDGIPPEEFLSARRMITLDQPGFLGQRKKLTVSELVSMGFPFEQVAMLPSDDGPEYSLGRTERLSKDETFPVTTAERQDSASREIWVTECFITIDEDGDGFSELRRILVAGDGPVYILEDEEINFQPICSITPVPTPHKFYGESLADLVYDLQVIRSTLVRQILDNIYLSNNPRLGIVEGMVEVNDLLTVRPGGLVRQRAPGQIEPIQLPPLPREAFQMLEYMEEIRANRTGVLAHGRDLDASAINSTATGMASLMAEKQQKIELIGRIFAATGVKKLGEKMLRLAIENDTKERQVELNGEWVTLNPSEWRSGFRCDVEVGLGAGQAVEARQAMSQIMEIQQAMAQAGGLGFYVTPTNIYESAKRFVEASGYRNPDLFFTNPEGREPPSPPPDPKIEKLKADTLIAEVEAKDRGADRELAAIKEQNIVSHRAAELAMKERVEMARIAMEERRGLGQQEASVEVANINSESKPNGKDTEATA